jgi:hypothetical protein
MIVLLVFECYVKSYVLHSFEILKLVLDIFQINNFHGKDEIINDGSKFVVLGYNSTYFSNKIQKGKTRYSEEQVISMLEFLIDWRGTVSAGRRHTNGYELCSSSSRFICILI